jgi:hypothetical protein
MSVKVGWEKTKIQNQVLFKERPLIADRIKRKGE